MTEVGPGTDNPYFLITNESSKATKISQAYDEIFGMINSVTDGNEESIFEKNEDFFEKDDDLINDLNVL